ncbi:hypothetical protein [Sandaracinobacteroides hominis]|uniref:hypothetical protein n=1 Tax=Sandaracinobacteroides hominis TaxID=2780086 RepID=UPI0018F68D08|nr:hypothetical protein [Sandaracinobacteroides hominis]
MTFALVSVLASLALILALNWNRFQQMGSGQILRMVLIWGVVIAALFLILRLFGF